MEPKRSWWQWFGYLFLLVLGVLVVLLIVRALLINGTGFDATTTKTVAQATTKSQTTTTITTVYQPGKTLWDWLNLIGVLAIPAVVGLGAVWYTAQQRKVSERETRDNQRHATLQAYLDKMSELLLNGNLAEQTPEGRPNPEYKQGCLVARVRTITVLTQLDARRVSYVFAFLREAELMSATKDDNAINLKNADLHAVDWSKADLRGADLRGADLSGANLRGAIFSNIIYVPRAFGGTLVKPNSANLSGTKLEAADLSGANLKGVTGITKEELEKQTKLLKGATMPDGSIHP